MKNQIEYKEGALIEDQVNNNTDNNLTFGNGTSYGIELFLHKQYGKLTGWIGYTLARTTRVFPEINFGEEFPAKYDRRHDVSLVTMYEINPQLNVSLVWVYATGNTATLPVSRYIIGGNIVNEYGPRNSFRMPAYHRMDVSVNYTPRPRKARKWESSWNFSIYNVYNRKNPYYIYFETKGNILEGSMEIKAQQVSLFPILPSVTYNFKF
jgi:outer membrane receptor protein involved in Fe transport